MPTRNSLTRTLARTTLTLALMAGCATHTQTGAVVGAAGGAVVGGVIGKAAGSTASGVIIGAAVGGATGAIIGAQMDKQAAELKQNIKGARVERVGEGIAVIFDSGLLFEFGSDAIGPNAQTNLKELARSLGKYPGSDLMIVGHTDNVGSEAFNQGLSERRANSAATYLVSAGVARTRIATRGMGENDPIASNETEDGRQANRRVEVAIHASEAYKAQVAKENK